MTSAARDGTFPVDPHSAAKIYLARGLAPIPLPTRSKDPGYPGWPHLRLDVQTLDQQFPRQQARNVGILNGEPSHNHLDVDLDCPQALLAAPILLPATGWVFGRPGARGSHRIYHADHSLDSAQHKYCDLDGSVLVELRGTGGLTVYPPSTHKETGEPIRWERFTEPGDVHLDVLHLAVREIAAVSLLARHWMSKGTRQEGFLALAGGLLRAGWSHECATRFVEAVAAATRDEEAAKRRQAVTQTAAKLHAEGKVTGWPALEDLLGDDGKAVVQRVRQWLALVTTKADRPAAPRKVRELLPYRPFPVEALPAPIAEYVRQGAAALRCDPAYLALPALAAAASLIGNTRTIELRRGWREPSIIWSVVIGDSGTLKSPAFHQAVGHLFRLQRRLLAEYKLAINNDTDARNQPVLRRVVVSDITVEKLAEVLEDNPRGILVARDELAAWIGSFTRYKGKAGGSDLPHWLSMFRAETLILDRKTGDRKHYYVPHAAVSIAGSIQPGVLARALTADLLDAGAGARLIMAMPPKLPKQWSEVEVDPAVEEAYHAILDKLLALDFAEKESEKVPHVVRLSREAKDAWVAFYNTWGREQAAVEGDLAAAYSKLEAYAARFALVHHVVSRLARGDDDRAPIERESIEAGVVLCRWCAHEARRIYATLTETDSERDTRRLVEFIRSRGGKITARLLQRSNIRKYPSAADAEAALDGLVQAELGTWTDPVAGPRGGQPARWLILHPTHDTTDTTPGDGEDDDDGSAGPAPDTTPDTTPPNPAISSSSGGFVGSVMRRTEGKATAMNSPNNAESAAGSVGRDRVVSGGSVGRRENSAGYRLVTDREGLDAVAVALDGAAMVAVDCETTGLNPRADRVRLLSVSVDTAGDAGRFTYIVDCFAVDPSPLWEVLAEKELVIHHAAFDLAFLAARGFTPGGKVYDAMHLAQLLAAGTMERVTLAAVVERFLGRTIAKDMQTSDWSGELSAEQLAYAAVDVDVLVPLLKAMSRKIVEAGLVEVAKIEQRCLPAVAWMGQQGVALDVDAWRTLARAAADEADRLRLELDHAAPDRPGTLNGCSPWNWDSPQQAQQALALAGCEVNDTADDTLAGCDHPLARILRCYRDASKRAGSFGDSWLSHVGADGRVYPTWRQLGAASGRMSCSDPNMQQLPRGDHRRCIIAPVGRVLVKADYSQIELRIAAKVSGDKALLDAYQRGDDLHVITARRVLGIEQVSRDHRQLAKAVNFGLLYGMGARGFRLYAKSNYGVELTAAEAQRYRAAFFESYPGLAQWHQRVRSRKTMETRTLAGRRRLLDSKTPDTHRLNTPVQGTGADGLKAALALLWERRHEVPGAFPVLAVHDEIVVEADADTADAAAAWLKAAMVDGMAPLVEPVPVEVDVKVGRTWGGK